MLVNPVNHKPEMVYLDNGKLKLGFDLARGAALSYLAAYPQLELNLVNDWDMGRLVQQSYYGSADGSTWAAPVPGANGKMPWRWASRPWDHGRPLGHPEAFAHLPVGSLALRCRALDIRHMCSTCLSGNACSPVNC